jgi:tetratricopeptide (TPR) repeat protein
VFPLCGAVALVLAACVKTQARGPRPVVHTSAARIQYYADRIAEHPRLYAAHLGLAQACLDQARETYDPAWLAKADAATRASLELLASVEGYKMQARLAAFRHRFAEALAWGRRAAELLSADVGDGAVTALLVEAHMGLGQYDEARKRLPPEGTPPPDFHTAAALGHWLVSQGRRDQAAAAFEAAARFAAAQDVKPLAAWARIMQAGVHLDAGRIEAARPHLKAAAALDPMNRELRIHEAELLAAEGRESAALARYEALLAEAPDAELHRRGFLLARRRGDQKRARAHFQAAEQLFLGVLNAGEGYTLEELARLYLDAGVNAGRALELATLNLEIKRDRSAMQTLEAARRAASRPEAASPPASN